MSAGQTLQVVLSLLFVVGLLLAAAWVARRNGWVRQRLGRANLKVLGTLSLGARSSVAIIQVEDSRLVVGITPQQITLLQTLPAQSQANFSESLNKAVARP
ncbi:MAG TPA: flagellar biosynthetic protein FliO [Castellaniella sp.]|uniref:flagellar biosynthetic protein FliO n=1 Tax=Castellaniella sp. TaxID=1955812 RepID=UPI002EFA9EF3